jgi:hypothetical protein
MKRFFLAFMVCSVALIFCCTTPQTLTEAGKTVKYVTKQEATSGCKELGEVTVGKESFGMPPTSIEEVKVRMQNKTAEMGGNFLVIDAITSFGNVEFSGSGRAYKCK